MTGIDVWKIALDAGSFGVLAWIVWFVFSKAVPAFITGMATQRKEFIEALAQQRKEFRDELTEERKAMTGVVDSVERLTKVVTSHDSAMREAHSRELQAMIESTIKEQFGNGRARPKPIG